MTNGQTQTLSAPVRVESEYRGPGCKYDWGYVIISVSPAESFSFKSIASWPAANYSGAVERGIIEGLTAAGYQPTLKAAFVLEDIKWHDVDSTEHAFLLAGRRAAEKILNTGQVVNSA